LIGFVKGGERVTEHEKTMQQYISVLRGVVNCTNRIYISWNNDLSYGAELDPHYQAGRDAVKHFNEMYRGRLLDAIELLEASEECKEFRKDIDYKELRHIMRCLIRYHKLTYYGKDCGHVCMNQPDLDGIPCEICENRKCPKEEIEYDLYLKALTKVLELLNRRGL
jgi:hypothetical protein